MSNAQDVSDADLGAALREFRRHSPLQASAAWHYATERAKDMNVARELQQAQLDGCTESNCQRCTTAPYARGDMKHAGIGSYPNTTPQSSAPVVGEAMVAVAYRVCEDFIEKHGDGYLNELDDGQWNEMLHAALTAALGKGER